MTEATKGHRALWLFCVGCHWLWMALPTPSKFESRYWKFSMWLLAWAGMYAHSEDYKWFCGCADTLKARTALAKAVLKKEE